MENSEQIFISYTREDWPLVRPIIEVLERNGASLWLDRTAIDLGSGIPDEIEKGLVSCTGAILFMSKTYLQKFWTIAERRCLTWRHISEGNLRLIVVRLDSSTVPPLLAPLLWVDHKNIEQIRDFFCGKDRTTDTVDQVEVVEWLSSMSDMEVMRISSAVGGVSSATDDEVPVVFTKVGQFKWKIKRQGQMLVQLITPFPRMAVEDLRSKVTLYEIHQRFCRSYENDIAARGLGIFTTAFEIAIEKETTKAKKAVSECREILDSVIESVTKCATSL